MGWWGQAHVLYLRARVDVTLATLLMCEDAVNRSTHFRHLLLNVRRCSSSMAAMVIDNVASLKVPCRLYSTQILPVSPWHPNPVVLSGSFRGRSSAPLISQ